MLLRDVCTFRFQPASVECGGEAEEGKVPMKTIRLWSKPKLAATRRNNPFRLTCDLLIRRANRLITMADSECCPFGFSALHRRLLNVCAGILK